MNQTPNMNLASNWSLQWKLVCGVCSISAGVLLLSGSLFYQYQSDNYREDSVRTLTLLADVFAETNNLNLSLAATHDPAVQEEAKTSLSIIHLEEDILSAALYDKAGTLFASYVRHGAAEPAPKAPALMEPRFTADQVTVNRPVLKEGTPIGTLHLVASLGNITARLNHFVEMGLMVLAGALLLTIALALGFQRLFTRPILALVKVARQVTQSQNYALRAPRYGGDELGRLTDDFNQMLTAIEAQNLQLDQANQRLQLQAAQLAESIEVLGTSARDISIFTTQSSTSAVQTAGAITETTVTVEQVRRSAQLANEKARTVADSSERSEQIAATGRKSAAASIEGMHHIRQEMEAIADSMLRLSERTQDIGQIVAAVEELSAQSHLLAVNAAIEAAKAGDQGKGFAIVAQEIRNLAEQSKLATTRVRGILKDIHQATDASVAATEVGSKAVDAGVELSTQVGEAIASLVESVQEAAQAATQISASSEEQLTGMDYVTSAMTGIKQASTQNVDSARRLEVAARQLNEMGDKLRGIAIRAPTLPQP